MYINIFLNHSHGSRPQRRTEARVEVRHTAARVMLSEAAEGLMW